VTTLSFGLRLRAERERRKISLAAISANTKISVALLEALERGDVSRWPSGIFRRSFVRDYAHAVGLDADATLREFLELFPDSIESAPVVPPAADAPQPLASEPALRLRVAEALAFTGGHVLSSVRLRWAAVAWDIGVLAAVALLLFVVLDHFWAPFGVLMLGYYGGAILLLGNTPGVCLFASSERAGREPAGKASSASERADDDRPQGFRFVRALSLSKGLDLFRSLRLLR